MIAVCAILNAWLRLYVVTAISFLRFHNCNFLPFYLRARRERLARGETRSVARSRGEKWNILFIECWHCSTFQTLTHSWIKTTSNGPLLHVIFTAVNINTQLHRIQREKRENRLPHFRPRPLDHSLSVYWAISLAKRAFGHISFRPFSRSLA